VAADDESVVPGLTRDIEVDESTGLMIVRTTQNVETILEDLQARARLLDARANWKGPMHHVGSIPLNVFYDLQQRFRDPRTGEIDKAGFAQARLRWIQDNPHFRARPGRLL